MHQRLRYLQTVISGLILCLTLAIRPSPSRACGPMLYSEEARFSLFQPATINLPALLPLQYTHDSRMKFEIPKPADDRVQNIQEWLKFGKYQFDSADVWALQYNTPADSFHLALSAKHGGAY